VLGAGRTALLYAVAVDHSACVHELLLAGASPDGPPSGPDGPSSGPGDSTSCRHPASPSSPDTAAGDDTQVTAPVVQWFSWTHVTPATLSRDKVFLTFLNVFIIKDATQDGILVTFCVIV